MTFSYLEETEDGKRKRETMFSVCICEDDTSIYEVHI